MTDPEGFRAPLELRLEMEKIGRADWRTVALLLVAVAGIAAVG